jgi:hypothetical protein
VGVGTLGILVDQFAGQQQMAGDDLGEILGQAAQFRPDTAVEPPDIGTRGDRRFGVSGLEPGRQPTFTLLVIITGSTSAVVGTGLLPGPPTGRSLAVEGRPAGSFALVRRAPRTPRARTLRSRALRSRALRSRTLGSRTLGSRPLRT